MSTASTSKNTQNQLNTNYDFSKLFLWNNRYESVSYTNGGGSTVTIEAGTLFGRINASGKVQPLVAAASDGSQFPAGILAQQIVVPAGATINVSMCVSGDVAEELILFNAAETFSTVVSGQTLRQLIASNTVGIKLVSAVENTAFDN